LAEAAVSKANDKALEVANANQSGGTITSGNFRQQNSIGDATAGSRLTSSNFRIIPGFLGATLSASKPAPVSDLDLTVLYAKTDPFGVQIAQKTWQKDIDPVFFWEPPDQGLDLAGYSYAIDATPDETVETTSTSFDVATSVMKRLADGVHTFSVKAVNTAGHSGKPISMELWIDTTPPQITNYGPSPGGLLNTANAVVSATVVDAGSGVSASSVELSINGSSTSVHYDPATGSITTSGSGAWKEGVNSLTLRVADVLGNVQTPIVWSVTVDTTPPSGTILINAGAEMTTSVYVTLTLTASDTTSGVDRMAISNEEAAGYVEEPFMSPRELWKLNPVRGSQRVYVKFVDKAGNTSVPIADAIELGLLAPETVLTSGPAGFTPGRSATFTFMCPEDDCVFSYAFDGEEWSDWAPATSITRDELVFGNHYFRVKAAKEVNNTPGIQPDEEDPSPAERTWVVGVEPSVFTVPRGAPIKVWRVE